MAKKTPVARPSVQDSPQEVALTVAQVKAFFPEAWNQAILDHEANLEASGEDWDPEEPGLLHPKDCRWSLQKEPENPVFTAYGEALEDYPGYALHMYDEEAIASFSGGGSDMVWTGEEWEM